jgi:hypothetical protein
MADRSFQLAELTVGWQGGCSLHFLSEFLSGPPAGGKEQGRSGPAELRHEVGKVATHGLFLVSLLAES